MGYVKHDMIAVTAFSEERMTLFEQAATALGLTLAGPVWSPVNGYLTTFVAPDGSKEGWPESDEGDSARVKIIEWLNAQRYGDNSSPYEWVHVQYGSDIDEGVGIAGSEYASRMKPVLHGQDQGRIIARDADA